MKYRKITNVLLLLLLTFGCSGGEKKVVLEGERKDALTFSNHISASAELKAQNIILPEAVLNSTWATSNIISPRYQNLKLTADLQNPKYYKVYVSRETNIGGSPVISYSKMFLLDSRGQIIAYDLSSKNKELWRNTYFQEMEANYSGLMSGIFITGGLTINRGVIYATGGLNQVIAIDASSGEMKWSKTLTSSTRAIPLIYKDRVIIQTSDGSIYNLNAESGNIEWLNLGGSGDIQLLYSTAPTASSNIIFAQRDGGELVALDFFSGEELWSVDLRYTFEGIEHTPYNAALNPVIDGQWLYLYSSEGTLFSINAAIGEKVWNLEVGIDKPFWIAGDWIFAVNNRSRLLAIQKSTGLVKWIHNLDDGQEESSHWSSPIIANGRIIVVSSNGLMKFIDPNTGKPVNEKAIDKGVLLPPMIAGGEIFLLSNHGRVIRYP